MSHTTGTFLTGPLSKEELRITGSYSWRSIWSSKALVKEGLIWRIGNGSKVNIWRDPWLSDEGGRFITSPEVESVKQVSDLIDASSMDWNLEAISSLFSERDQKCILSIPLSWRSPSDVLSWAYSNDGLYSTKTSYMLGKGCNLNDLHLAWMEIWEMEVPPKVRHFFWRLCSGTLPTKSLLKKRHLMAEAGCPWCMTEEETSVHAIFECNHVKHLWKDSGCGMFLEICNMDLCAMIASWAKVDPKIKHRAAILAWCVWSERNLNVFESKSTPGEVIISRVLRLAEEYGNYSKSIYRKTLSNPSRSLNKWSPPPEGVIKLNADASLAVEGVIGMGVVARDHTGKVLAAVVRRVRAWWSPEIAEARAILLAGRLAKRMGYMNISLETDCQVITHRLSKAAIYLSDLDGVLEDILALCTSFNRIDWSHVKRSGNSVAHHLAKFVPFGLEQMWVNSYPTEISHYVTSDILS